MGANLFGLDIDTLFFDDALIKATKLLSDKVPAQVVTINPEMFAEAEKSQSFTQIIKEAEMVIPDSIGVKIALNINGYQSERIPGIDFAWQILELASKNEYSVAIIGAREDILNMAVSNIKLKYANINIVYMQNGFFTDSNEVYKELLNVNPDIILVAMGSPKQEKFIYEAKKILNKGLMIGIGGSLDVWSGIVARAPKIFRITGTEWLYRTVSQPKRFKRIFPTLPLFLLKAIIYKFCK